MTATFEQVRETTTKFGTNSYLEVARKRLKDESGQESEFLVVSRGFFAQDGSKRWTKFVTVPDEPGVKEWLSGALKEV